MSRARVLTPAVVLVMVAAVIGVFVATSGGSTKSTTSGSAISVARTSLGQTLVDANGRTLYLFEADRPNVSTLSAAGRAIWPPFTAAGTPRALNGASAGAIGTILGSGQVTYNGHPLYYYVGDQMPGQTTGQGLDQFGALWYVLSPRGDAILNAPKSVAAGGAGAPGGPSYSGTSSYPY